MSIFGDFISYLDKDQYNDYRDSLNVQNADEDLEYYNSMFDEEGNVIGGDSDED